MNVSKSKKKRFLTPLWLLKPQSWLFAFEIKLCLIQSQISFLSSVSTQFLLTDANWVLCKPQAPFFPLKTLLTFLFISPNHSFSQNGPVLQQHKNTPELSLPLTSSWYKSPVAPGSTVDPQLPRTTGSKGPHELSIPGDYILKIRDLRLCFFFTRLVFRSVPLPSMLNLSSQKQYPGLE